MIGSWRTGRRTASVTVLFVLLSAMSFAETLEGLAEAPIRIGILGDRTGNHQGTVHAEIVQEVARMRPDVVIGVGDMIEGYSEDTAAVNAEWREYHQILEPLGDIPFYPTCGNHDITNETMAEPFESHFGSSYYSWDYRGVHFVMIDNSRWWESAQLESEQLDWIEKDLAEHSDALYTVAFYHRPFWYNTTSRGKPDTLHSLFVAYGVDAVISGHFHRYFSGEYDGIRYTCIGSSGGGWPDGPWMIGYHYGWMTIDDEGVHVVPVAYNAAKPWDVFRAEDLHFYGRLNRDAVTFVEPVAIDKDLRIVSDSVVVEIANPSDEFTVDDTLLWDSPEDWSVTPPETPLHIGPGETARVSFAVECEGQVYPSPRMTARFPYRAGASFEVSADLQLVRSAVCVAAGSPPQIDGRLDDACWSQPEHAFFDDEGGTATTDSTRFYFAYDNTCMYLAVWCYEPMMDQLKVLSSKRDGAVYADDCVGCFFYPNDPQEAVYQVYVNPDGVVFDQRIVPNEDGYFDGDFGFDGDYRIAAEKGLDHWVVEMAIPVSEFQVRSMDGSDWKLNFRRKQQRLGSNADWQLPIDRDPRWFGILKMR